MGRGRWRAASSAAGIRLQDYEFKLLAALAQCYRGKKTFADLPMIPIEMADLIIRQGGLQTWLCGAEYRVALHIGMPSQLLCRVNREDSRR